MTATPPNSAAKRKRFRRQKGLLTALGFVFAASAVMRIGALDYASAETEVAEPPEIAESTPPLPGFAAPLQSAIAEIEEMRTRLLAREAALLDREQAVAAAQTLVEARLEELHDAEMRLEALIAQSDGAAEADLARLTQVYEAMPPEEAAALFAEMPPSFAAGFLSRMGPASSAALMAELPPDTAYAVSLVVATRNATAPTFETLLSDTEN